MLWVLNHYAIAPGSPGGTRHYDLACQLVKKGWEVTIFASSFDHHTHSEKHLQAGERFKEEIYNGVRFVWLKTTSYKGNSWRRVVNMFSYTLRVLIYGFKYGKQQKPQVIIGSSLHPFAAWTGYILSRCFKCPFVFEVRDLWPQTLIDLGKASPFHPVVVLLRWLELFLYRRAVKTIVLLPGAHKYIQSRGIPAEKIFFLPNGVDLARYDKKDYVLPPALEEVVGNLKNKVLFVYAGSHGLANSLDTLLDAARILKENGVNHVHLLLIGDGPEKSRLMQRAGKEGLSNVTFADPVPKDSVPSLLNKAFGGIFCLVPSPLYNYGISLNKIFDYMAAGLPVIMTGQAFGNPISISGGGIVLPGGNAEALAKAMSDLANDTGKASDMGKKARSYVEKEHSMEVLGNRLNDLLTGLLR